MERSNGSHHFKFLNGKSQRFELALRACSVCIFAEMESREFPHRRMWIRALVDDMRDAESRAPDGSHRRRLRPIGAPGGRAFKKAERLSSRNYWFAL
jgi:hypothetical protein